MLALYGRFIGASRNHARLTSYLSAYFRNRWDVTVTTTVTKHEEAGSGVTTTDTGVTTEKSRNSPQHKGSVTAAESVTAESVTTSLLTWLGPELLGVTDVTEDVTATGLDELRNGLVVTAAQMRADGWWPPPVGGNVGYATTNAQARRALAIEVGTFLARTAVTILGRAVTRWWR